MAAYHDAVWNTFKVNVPATEGLAPDVYALCMQISRKFLFLTATSFLVNKDEYNRVCNARRGYRRMAP